MQICICKWTFPIILVIFATRIIYHHVSQKPYIQYIMRLLALLPCLIAGQIALFSQVQVPLAQKNFEKITTYAEISAFVSLADSLSDLICIDIIGKSVQQRNIYALKFSSTVFGQDKSKIKVLFVAQQHGNEQSGKEGALLLIAELLKPENRDLFNKMDFALIPQLNPDGSEQNQRRNGRGIDLNRNHMLLTEPEVIALHQFFNQYHFDVTLDIHEYYPYGESWKGFGYRKNSDVTIGAATNLNVDEKIRTISDNTIIPYFMDFVKQRGYSSFVYYPGGPPNLEYLRRSTIDIDDGRQSFAVQNTFSFIQEGMNGTDVYIENIRKRSFGQMYGMLALLNYVEQNHILLKKCVADSRKKLMSPSPKQKVSIQGRHLKSNQPVEFPMFSYHSGRDTVVLVSAFHPNIASVLEVQKPVGYLIPKIYPELKKWADSQGIRYTSYEANRRHHLTKYLIEGMEKVEFEGDTLDMPKVRLSGTDIRFEPESYYFIPCNQLKGNFIVMALEPQSVLGLVRYKEHAWLLQQNGIFPIHRVDKK
jgi:hypothetical protein